MSINDINIIRIVCVCIIVVLFVALVVSTMLNVENRRKTVFKILAYFMVALIAFLFNSFYGHKIDDNNKRIIEEISVNGVNYQLFDVASDKANYVNEKYVLARENEDIAVYLYIVPKENEMHSTISPTRFEKKQGLIVTCFYGSISIPINEEHRLLIEYECQSDMEECNNFIYGTLRSVIANNAVDGSPSSLDE